MPQSRGKILTGFSVLTHPQHLQAVFKDSDKHYKAENNNSGYLMSQLLGQCLGLISRELWRPLRSVAEIPFQHQKMSFQVDMVSRHVTQHFDDLHASGNLGLGRINAAQDLKMLPFWIVAEMLYGQIDANMKAELQQLSHLREQLWTRMIQGGHVRWNWSHYLPTTTNRKLREFQSRWASFNHTAYDHAQRQDPSLPIVALMNSVGDGTINMEQVLQTIDEALFANLDVTTGGISWNLVFLAAHPQAQDRVRSEALEAADPKSHVLSSSTFVNSCVLESARLKPLAAFSVPQSAPTPRVVGGYVVPARTDFVVDTYALNIRNDFWGPDRQQYRPERFLEHRPTDLRYQYWRFGFGPRNCMGRYLADLVIRSLLVHLTTHYELGWLGKTASDNTEWSRDLESWITLPDMELSCVLRKH